MEIIYLFIGINLVSFMLYGIDKRKALKHKWRIRESVLLLFALFGGGLGSLLGMSLFHHKTNKVKFKYGIPLLTLVNIALFLLYLDVI